MCTLRIEQSKAAADQISQSAVSISPPDVDGFPAISGEWRAQSENGEHNRIVEELKTSTIHNCGGIENARQPV